jgi:REP element-mobilizing transposase RayT
LKENPSASHISIAEKNIRLQGYDYSSAGFYFITICTHVRQNLLCDIIVGQGLCSCRILDAGEISQTELFELEKRYNHIKIDKNIIMPNHIHVIIAVGQRQEQSPCPTIMDIICTYKSITTKRYNNMLGISGKTLWQSRFHDHIIRSQAEYQRIRQYIDDNPARWREDRYYEGIYQ